MKSTYLKCLKAVAITFFATFSCLVAAEMPAHVGKDGSISLPDDYRATMVHMGSWYVPAGEASGFHDVYTEQSTIEHYRKTGEFPDGATLVKELRADTKGNYTTGQGVAYANDTIKQVFVMIKDSKGQFKNAALWGDGWGWALFKPDNMAKNVTTNYKTECIGCHIPAKKTDLIYVEGYPTLKK